MSIKKLFSDSVVGSFLAFSSAISFACAGMFFKMIQGMYYTQAFLYRLAVTSVLLIPIYLCCSSQPLVGDFHQNKWVSLVAIGQAATHPMRFLAISLMPYADLYALTLSEVMLLTLVMGKLWLKESCGILETITSIVILASMVMIMDPVKMIQAFANKASENSTVVEKTRSNFTADTANDGVASIGETAEVHNRMLGITLATIECFINAATTLCARKVQVHYSIITLHITFWSAIFCTVVTLVFGYFSLPTVQQLVPLAGFALGGAVFLSTYFQSLVYQEAGVVCTIRTTEIPVSYVLQAVFLNTFPTLLVSLGSTVISITTIVFGVLTWTRENKTREYEDFPEFDS